MKSKVHTIFAIVASTSLLVGCAANGTPEQPANTVDINSEARNLLPQSIRDGGKLLIGLDISSNYPPYVYFDEDGRTPLGTDVDLTIAVAQKLGLKADVMDIGFDSLVTSLDSSRIHVGAGALGDTLKRQEMADFIDYADASPGAMVLLDNSQVTADPESLCGLQVATFPASSYYEPLTNLSSSVCINTEAGEIEQSTFASSSDAILALRSGRVDAMVALYVPLQVSIDVAEADDLKSVALVDPEVFERTYLAIGVSKKENELRDAILLVVEEMHVNGELEDILEKWGIGETIIKEVSLNEKVR